MKTASDCARSCGSDCSWAYRPVAYGTTQSCGSWISSNHSVAHSGSLLACRSVYQSAALSCCGVATNFGLAACRFWLKICATVWPSTLFATYGRLILKPVSHRLLPAGDLRPDD